MSAPPATAEFDRAGRHLTVYLAGELDETTAPGLTGTILRHIRPDDERVWIDLATVTACDDAGIDLLLQIGQHLQDRDTYCIVCDPAPHIERALVSSNVDKRISIRSA